MNYHFPYLNPVITIIVLNIGTKCYEYHRRNEEMIFRVMLDKTKRLPFNRYDGGIGEVGGRHSSSDESTTGANIKSWHRCSVYTVRGGSFFLFMFLFTTSA